MGYTCSMLSSARRAQNHARKTAWAAFIMSPYVACVCASLVLLVVATSLAHIQPQQKYSVEAQTITGLAGYIDNNIAMQRTYNTSVFTSGSSCRTGNPIDDCWRCDPNWASNRRHLADCAVGFGRGAVGGKAGLEYVVTSAADKPVNPQPGTLRHAILQREPLWITFASDMTIVLKQSLVMKQPLKTIDGRGHNVHIAYGPCLIIEDTSNIIIHGVHVHDCKATGRAIVQVSPTQTELRLESDGDSITIVGSKQLWIDHIHASHCADGLIDATLGSTDITISNSFFSDHDKVMLFGHSDDYQADRNMQVTVAFNHFGQNLIERMPRCRHGFFEVVNNQYSQWAMYAVGGSASPTISSHGNYYVAPNNPFAKAVMMRMDAPQSVWQAWNWRSQGDIFLNGAHFDASGAGANDPEAYANAQSHFTPVPAFLVPAITAQAGPLTCINGAAC